MSHQRRRGLIAKIWKTHQVTDRRGNTVTAPNMDAPPHEVRVAFKPGESTKGEVPGQVGVGRARIIVDHDLEDIDLWSRVEVNGTMYDIDSPPSYHHGTRHSRHVSIELRSR